MIEIALCDDSAEDVSALRSFTRSFAAEHPEFPIHFTSFFSSAELVDHLENKGGFDLYILDVVMPRMSGIALAEVIRERGERAEIIFLTVSREYAVDAFSVRASGYLLKPVCKKDFDKELIHSIQKLTHENSEAFTVRTKDGVRRIRLHDLVMVESFNHTRALTLADDSILETTITLAELFDQLNGHLNFVMPHRAYIANLDYSMGIKRYELLMMGGRRIPIPRKQYAIVQDVFSNYFFK